MFKKIFKTTTKAQARNKLQKDKKQAATMDSDDDYEPQQPERIPSGVTPGRGLSPVSWISVAGIGAFAEGVRHFQNTYEVKEKHERLANGRQGVRFNVETLPEAESQHLHKRMIGREEYLSQIAKAATDVYSDSKFIFEIQSEPSKAIRLEAASKCPDNLVFVGGQGFFAACLSAFAQHLPLAMSPDHIWCLISYAFAMHVDKHAEELRSNFVQHEGKKRLEVGADHMVMSGGQEGADSGSPPEVWEQTIFPSFSHQIKEHIGEKIHSAVAGDFSTTDTVSRAAHEITLMSAMKHYFSYGMSTCCGIPNITLLGSEQDWITLRERAEALGDLMTTEFKAHWMPFLLPVLDEFVASYKGNVNHGFWQSMVKLRASFGSGATDMISGWIQLFYPYIGSGEINRNLRPWQEMYFSGPEPDEIPSVLSSAPVDWNYYGTTHNLHFCAGFTGCTQDPQDGTISPSLGWFVTHDPPRDPMDRLKVVTEEMRALVKGHAEEANAAVIDKDEPWYRRVAILYQEHKAIRESLMKKLQQDSERIRRESGYSWYSKKEKTELEQRVKDHKAGEKELASTPEFTSAGHAVRTFCS